MREADRLTPRLFRANARFTRSTDHRWRRPLVQLTLRYIESLLKWDRETVVSLVTESYRHLTAFGDSFGQSLLHFGKAGKVKGEIDSVYCDEDQKAVSIERRYETNDKMTEIIDLVYWEDPGPRIHR